MSKKKWRNIISFLSVMTMIVSFGGNTVMVNGADFSQSSYNQAVTLHDFGIPSVRYTGVYYDGTSSSGQQGSWVTRNETGALDDKWLQAVYLYNTGTGGYEGLGNPTVKAHLHNYGWTNAYDGATGVVGTDFYKYGWIEALQLSATTSELGNYVYLNYATHSHPLSWQYVVWKSGGETHSSFSQAEKSLLANNPHAKDSWKEGYSVFVKPDGTYRNFFSTSTGAVCPYIGEAANKSWQLETGGNWAGTTGYSMPLIGFEANLQEYPCNVYVNPNGGTWAGATSTVQVGNVGGESTVHAGDNLTIHTVPVRSGYEFAGWDITSTSTEATAATFYQKPNTNIAPVLTAGNGSAVYKGIDYSMVYDYNYYKNQYADLRSAFGNDSSKYLAHFVNSGMIEGRRGNDAFDVQYYKNKYADLRSAFGNNLVSYYYHYMQSGIFENRMGNGKYMQISDVSSVYVGNAGSVTLTAKWKKENLDYTVHFDGNGATTGHMDDQTMRYDMEEKLSKNAYVRDFDVSYDVNGGSSVEKTADSVVSDFVGWKVSPGAVNPSYSDEQKVKNLAKPGETRNLYAGWHDKAVILPNAGKADEYQVVDEDHKGWVKYYFLGWYTAPDGGQCVGRGGDAYVPKANVTLYAHWSYEVCIYYDGNTNDGGGMTMDDPVKGDIKPYGQTYTIRENGYSKTGYDFFGWNTAQVDGAGNLIENGKEAFAPGSAYNEDIPLTLFAAWRNRFDIAYMGMCQTKGEDFFDNNGGNDYSQLADTVKLSKAENMKTTATKSFIDRENGREVVEDVTGTGVGWAFAKNIEAKYKDAYLADDTEYPAADFFGLAREAGAVTYGSASQDYQGEIPALNSPDMAVANMYRVWDYGPLVEAYDLYYTLEQARSGYITEDELLSHATATDEEDGEIPGGNHEDKGNSFRVMDYSEGDFTGFQKSGSVTETYLAIDHIGNQTKKMVTVYIVDTEPKKLEPEGTTRFISEKYYNLPYEEGGLKEDSVWKTEPECRQLLEKTFTNQRNGTPEKIYTFSHEDVLKMQEYIRANGVGNTKSPDALMQFYQQFME